MLNSQIMEDAALQERNQIEAGIRACSLALEHYRAALKIENGLLRG